MGFLKRRAPSEEEVFKAFEEAKRGNPELYGRMNLDEFFYAWLIGRGWSGPEAAEFVHENPVEEGYRA